MFDLDGTLLDTLDDLANAVNHAMRSVSRPEVPCGDVRRFIGRGSRNLIADSLGPDPEGLLNGAHDRFIDFYREHLFDKTRPYPGMVELIGELRGRGMKLAVLSNKPAPMTRHVVDHYFPASFDRVVGQRDDVPRKPDPISALSIAHDLGIQPQQWAYIGDSGIDMQTGKSAGFFTIGITWGFRDEPELREFAADAIAHDVDQLRELLIDDT